MSGSIDASKVVEAVLAAFPDPKAYPTEEDVEAVMRPFGVISDETEREIDHLLHEKGRSSTSIGIGCWMEANFVVGGSGPAVERKISFLLMDTCTCVLAHLPKALENATGPVDPRIQALMNHEYFTKGKG